MVDERYAPPAAPLDAVVEQNSPPLWNPNAVGLWSFLLTPVFGSTLLLYNWRAIGDAAKQRESLVWLWVSVAMLVVCMLFPVVTLPYLVTWYLSWQSKQTKYVVARWGNGYTRRGWGRPLAIALGVCVASALVLGTVTSAVAEYQRLAAEHAR